MSTSGAKAGQAFNFNFSFVDSADPTSFYTTQIQTSEVNIYQRNGASLSGPVAITTQPTVSGSIHTISLTSGEMVGPDEVILEFSGTGFVSENVSISLEAADADVVSVSGDATAADNLELQYDGTGLTGDTFPATQASVANIGSGTAGAVNYEASGDNTGGSIKGVAFVGSVSSGSYLDTAVEDGTVISIDDTANDIDYIMSFDVGGGNQSVEAEIVVNLDGNADQMVVKAYDFIGLDWDTIGFIDGSGGAAFQRLNLSLLARHTGTGSDLGFTYIRFDTESTTPANLSVDKVIVGAVSTTRTVGYSNGSVWIDTTNGVAGVESFVNGVADNPVATYANATTLAGAVGLTRYTYTAGDSITLTQSHAADSFFGYNYIVDMNGQAPPTYIEGAEIVGQCNGPAAHYVRDCRVGTVGTALQLEQGAVFVNSGLVNVDLKDAAGAALDVEFLDCHGNTQGSMFPGGSVDFGLTAGTNHEVSFQRWGGPVTMVNLKDGDTVYAHGNGTFILDASCTGGSFRVAGMINLVDNSGGAVSILEDGRITRSGIASEVWSTDQTTFTTANTFGYNLDAQVSSVGGGGGGTDWTTGEKEEIRYRLGIDGTTSAPATNTPDLAQKSDISGLNDIAATDIVSAGPITTLSGAVVNVDTVDSVTGDVTTDAASRTASQADVSALATSAEIDEIKGAGWVAGDNLAEIAEDVAGLNGDAMRGTEGANTTTPPTVVEIRTEIDANSTKLADILDDTGTSGVVISTAQAQSIADEILKRSVGNVEGAALDEHSLATVVLAILESQRSGSSWTIYRTDGATPQASKVLTLDASAQPVVRVQ
jgi:hypothetical protein